MTVWIKDDEIFSSFIVWFLLALPMKMNEKFLLIHIHLRLTLLT